MYINNLDNTVGVDKDAMESLLNFWLKEGIPMPEFFEKSLDFDRVMIFRARHVASGKNEDFRLFNYALKNNLIPIWNEYLEDTFVSVSRPKLNLLHLKDLDGKKIKLVNPNKWEKEKLSDIVLDSGENMVQYHHKLWDEILGEKYRLDASDWLKNFGSAKDYYFADLSTYTAFGMLAADFHGDNNPLSSKKSSEFTKNIVIPSFKKVEQVFGVKSKILKFSYQEGDELYPNL